MENKTSSLWMLVILALFGSTIAMLPGASSSGAPTPAPTASAAIVSAAAKNTTNEASGEHTALAMLTKFFCGEDDSCTAEEQAEKGGYTIDSMIVTVPDPVESGLGADFDNMIDTVQRAAEANHLLLDRYDLPWLTSGPSSENAAGEKVKRDPNLEPGLMLFRSSVERNVLESNEILMLVFVVGETPTDGVHNAAFQSALGQICDVRANFKFAAPTDSPKIKVLGPSYSGSADSMVFAINDAREKYPACELGSFRIISGGATAVDAKELQSLDGVHFHATINPDSGAIPALLLALGDQASQVALLSEAGTSYGDITVEGLGHVTAPLPALIRLKFPIHIAEIEKAAGETASNAETSVASILEHPELPLGPSAGARRDLVPIFSQSDLSTMQLELDNILKVIADQHIRYVVIAATDVDDTVYLAGELRDADPNATIISLNHNVLYEHNDVNPNLHGMLVASTYPLFVENQPWTSPLFGPYLPTQFPTDTAEGAFNAFEALLNDPDKMVDYGLPFDSTTYKPPLWLSVVGRGGVWPVAMLSVDDPDDYTFTAQPDYPWEAPPYQWPTRVASFVGGVLLAGVIALMFMMWLARTRPHTVPAPIAQYFGDSVFDEYRGVRRFYQYQAALIALVILIVFLLFALMPGRWLGTFPTSTVGLGTTISAGEAAAASEAIAAMRVLRATHLDDGVSPITPVLFAGAAALVMMFAAIRRRILMETHQLLTRILAFDTPSFEGVAEMEREVREASEGDLRWSWGWWALMAATVAVYFFVIRSWNKPPIDGRVFEILYLLASTFAYLWIATDIFRIVTVWLATRRLLHRMYWHPSRDGYATIHEDMPGEKDSRIDLTSALPNMTAVEAGLAFARGIAVYEVDDKDKTFTVPKRLAERREALAGAISEAERRVEGALDFAAKGLWAEQIRIEREIEEKLGAVSGIVAYIFEPAWRLLGRAMRTGGDDPIKHPPLLELGEAYVASRVADLLRRVMPQLRTLAVASTAGVLLMLLAASSYPFPAADDLLWFSWGMVVLAVASTTWMFVSINRDRVVSLLSGTTPGSTNWNSTFVTQLATHALVPVLVLLGAAFPERLSRVLGWVGGILGGGHGG
jgi:hypothetical protein